MEEQQARILPPASGLCLLLLLQSSVLPLLCWHEGHGNPPVKHFLMFYRAEAQALLEGGLWHYGSQRFLQQLLWGHCTRQERNQDWSWGLGAGAAGAEVLLTPRAVPTARAGQRDGHEQQPLLSVFPTRESQHSSADPGNAVQELVEGVRPQQCCG